MTKSCLTFTALTTLTFGLALFSAPASASPDRALSADLETLADAMGDEHGQLRQVDSVGAEQVVVQDIDGELLVYTSGDLVDDSGEFSWCYDDPNGSMSVCELVGAPGGTAFECFGEDIFDMWCECYDVGDCFIMALAEVCTQPIQCGNGVCYCI